MHDPSIRRGGQTRESAETTQAGQPVRPVLTTDSGSRLPAAALAATALAIAVVPTAATATAASAAVETTTEIAEATTTAATIAASVAVTTTTAATKTTAGTPTAAETSGGPSATESTTAAGKRAGLRLEAVATVDRAVATGFKGDLRFFATGGAYSVEKLPRGPAVTTAERATSVAILLLLQPTAVRTAPGFPRETFRSMKFLFTRGEHERLAAITADERLVGVRHPIDLLD